MRTHASAVAASATLAMQRSQKRVRLLRVVGAPAHVVFAAVKPAGVPLYSAANAHELLHMSVGDAEHGPRLVSTPQDIEDSLLNRVCDATGYTAEAAAALLPAASLRGEDQAEQHRELVAAGGSHGSTASASPDDATDGHLPAPLLVADSELLGWAVAGRDAGASSSSSFSPPPNADIDHLLHSGLTLVASDPRDYVFLTRAGLLGAIERTFHVLCHVPRCIRADAHELLDTADVEHLALQRRVHEAEQKLQEELGAFHALVPGCITRDPYIRGRPFIANTLARECELSGWLISAKKLSDEQRFHRRLGSLFVTPPAPRTSDNARSGSEGLRTRCDPSCCATAAPNVSTAQHLRSSAAPASASGLHGALELVGCPAPEKEARRKQFALNEHLLWLPRGHHVFDRMMPVKLSAALQSYNPTLAVAHYIVTTCSSAAAVRAAFAGVGMPVVNDVVYSLADRRRLLVGDSGGAENLAPHRTRAAVAGGKGRDSSGSSRGADAAGAVAVALKRWPLQGVWGGSGDGAATAASEKPLDNIGSGIVCTGLRFPDPRSQQCQQQLDFVAELLRAGDHSGSDSVLASCGAVCSVQIAGPANFAALARQQAQPLLQQPPTAVAPGKQLSTAATAVTKSDSSSSSSSSSARAGSDFDDATATSPTPSADFAHLFRRQGRLKDGSGENRHRSNPSHNSAGRSRSERLAGAVSLRTLVQHGAATGSSSGASDGGSAGFAGGDDDPYAKLAHLANRYDAAARAEQKVARRAAVARSIARTRPEGIHRPAPQQ